MLQMPWILFHERCYDMEHTVSSWNTHPLIAVIERVIHTSLFLLSPNEMKFIDLLLANRIHILWLNKALKMKIFWPSQEVYRSKLNEQVTLSKPWKGCIGLFIVPVDNKLTHQTSREQAKESKCHPALASLICFQFSEIEHIFCG